MTPEQVRDILFLASSLDLYPYEGEPPEQAAARLAQNNEVRRLLPAELRPAYYPSTQFGPQRPSATFEPEDTGPITASSIRADVIRQRPMPMPTSTPVAPVPTEVPNPSAPPPPVRGPTVAEALVSGADKGAYLLLLADIDERLEQSELLPAERAALEKQRFDIVQEYLKPAPREPRGPAGPSALDYAKFELQKQEHERQGVWRTEDIERQERQRQEDLQDRISQQADLYKMKFIDAILKAAEGFVSPTGPGMPSPETWELLRPRGFDARMLAGV